MRKCRKSLAILLCAAPCFSLLPTWAFAEWEFNQEEILFEEDAAEMPEQEDVIEEEGDTSSDETTKSLVADEVTEDLVVEESADERPQLREGDPADNAALLEELEAAIADENVHSFDLSELGEFVISKDLAVYGGMALNTSGATATWTRSLMTCAYEKYMTETELPWKDLWMSLYQYFLAAKDAFLNN